jgi:Tol biopolymer transport system component
MSLIAGTRLGPYEILAPIGAGGMGEVYRAKDTKLEREVAIKVLPAALAQDPERLARFEREAKVLASLNHPNVAHIYGIEERALVMELVPGEALKGPLALETALNYAKQIADALEAAHEKGIVHRDLKPANIMVTPNGVVKVLDFGLAAVPSRSPDGADPASSPTMTIAATQAGMIMGTAAYMSPEQAAGKPVDKRADIWSFGVVLLEMLTGERLFDGETISHTLAAVLTKEPDLQQVPVKARRLLQSCLQKDPRRRLRDIGDMELLLAKSEPATTAPTRSRLAITGWVAAGVLLLAAAALAFIHFRETPPAETALRLSVPLPDNVGVGYLALSPDGRIVAIAGGGKLWLRALDSFELRPLSNTANARHPFWSPDGRSLGFSADGKLKIISVTGGPATALCDAGTGGGGAWSREGVILFGADKGPIERVNAAGGACTPVTRIEPGMVHHLPTFLPDGKHFLYNVQSEDPGKAGLSLAALDQPDGRRLLPDRTNAIFVPRRKGASHDHLLFSRENALMAQPFDTDTLQLAGDPFPVAPQLSRTSTPDQVAASAAGNGTLIYLAGSSFTDYQATWLDRSGKKLGKVGPLEEIRGIALSPDQKSVAFAYSEGGPRAGLWLRELARDVESRFALLPFSGPAVWSPDSSRIVFAGPNALYVKALNGGQEQLLLQRGNPIASSDWSRDGKYLLYTEIDPKTHGDIWYLQFEPSGKPGAPVAFLRTEFNESMGQFSPDGRWVAYISNESGSPELYVRPFPSGGGPVRISSSAGSNPRWRADGKELYYLSRPGLMAVSVQSRPGGPLQAGVPKALFDVQTRTIIPEANQFSYSPSADGQRFLMRILPDATLPTLNVITNWEKAAAAAVKEP